jgi:hypothetical protein
MCSAQLDTTAPAPPRNSLVVVGNPIYLMFQIVHFDDNSPPVIFTRHVLRTVDFCCSIKMLRVSGVLLQVLLQEGINSTNQ